jgi:hypothetical protein
VRAVIEFGANTGVIVGVALACHAAVENKEGLYAVRFLLGLVGLHSISRQAYIHLTCDGTV